MNLIELSKYLQDEKAAEDYLYEKGILKRFTECPYCGSDKIGSISRGRIKCYKCKKEWHKRKRSFLEGRHISAAKFVALLKLYSEELNPVTISKEISIERKAVLDIIHSIKLIILKDFSEMKISQKELILFVKDGVISIQEEKLVKGISYMLIEPVRYKEFGNIYSFLLKSKWIGKKTNDLNTINNFLSFVKMKSINYAGISEKYFLEYLFELIIKFNSISQSFYEMLLNMLSFQRVVETTQPRKK
jgi:transposase-like protein